MMDWMNELLIEAVPILAPAVAALVVALLAVGAAYLRRLASQIESDVARRSLDSAIAEAHLAAATAVRETQQTLVDEWRKRREDGTLTPEERSLAIEAARERFGQVLSQRSLDVLVAALGPVQDWMDSLLEAQVQALKVQRDPLRAKVEETASPKS